MSCRFNWIATLLALIDVLSAVLLDMFLWIGKIEARSVLCVSVHYKPCVDITPDVHDDNTV